MPLESLPDTFAATREALHTVAERLVAPARKPENEIALTATPGGFGTPPFEFQGVRTQVRVEGAELVLERNGELERAAITSLADGGRLLGADLVPGGLPDDPDPLAIDPLAAERLAQFYAFAARTLESLRAGLPATDDPSPVNLWPEHFDIAFEAGSEVAGARANYGASPGDEDHAEPYLYVGPWTAPPQDELWNATSFDGAELAYAELVAAADPAGLATEFFVARRAALAART
jgi:hypothetical protein